MRKWRQKQAQLENITGKTKRVCLTGAGRKILYPDIQESLTAYIKRRREAGCHVFGKVLKIECLRLHKLNVNQSFKASHGWLRKSVRRHNFSFCRATHIGQKKTDVLDDRANEFLRYVIQLRKRHNYNLSKISKMDETPI